MALRIFLYGFLLLSLSIGAGTVYAQLDKITLDLHKEKPDSFKNRKLRSEKTGEKKLGLMGKFVQNGVSHYNYYFNADQKINAVIENARTTQQDDYTHLLPYYSYSLENTANQKRDLDSVIQKATAGILLHDLRTNWVDNFYLLIGQAYYLEKEFDSAYMAFQFINYNLAPKDKKKSEYDLTVGSHKETASNAISVANKEDPNLVQKVFSMRPSRNDALVWQVRTLTDLGLYAEASGLINTLRNDPNFPSRLENYLNEVEGYWFYQQGIYDSAARYIELALPNSIDLQDQARREYLLGQLYQNKGSLDSAYNFYSLAIRHTTNPLLDIYANLNRTRLFHEDNPDEVRTGIATLLRMARKDKYQDYRHIIYNAAGELALELPDTLSAISFFGKSAYFNQNDIPLKNKAFLQLANLSYDLGKYENAYNAYDSLQTSDSTLGDIETINQKKAALAKLITELNIIEREDSLQMVAAMPTADREAFLKKLSKKLRKERGISDDETAQSDFGNPFQKEGDNPDLFTQNNAKGGWYFYNQSLRSRGFNDFKREWGNRQNVDNWRRVSSQSSPTARNQSPGDQLATNRDPLAPVSTQKGGTPVTPGQPEQSDVSVEGLRANLPLTQPGMDSSNSKIAVATFALGKAYQDLLEDYPAAVNTYETSLTKFPDSLYGGEMYMNLAYCYRQLGNPSLANKYENLLKTDFPKSTFTEMVLHPEKYDPKYKDTLGTSTYDRIYTQFIEGNFSEAIAAKKRADSIYGKTYWSPQLLYIESVYYVKQRDDSSAIVTLTNISTGYPNTPMSERAANLIRVLKNRDSIENYLTNLKVVRIPEDSQIVVQDDTRIYGNIQQRLVRNDSNLLPRKITTVDVPELKDEKKLPAPIKNKNFVFDAYSPQNVVMVLTKVDPVYSSEARTAFVRYAKSKFYNRTIDIRKDTIDADRTIIVFSGFISAEDAMGFMNSAKHDAPGEISWLPANKYSFLIISDDNLELLKENKKLDSYIDLLREKFPGKF